MPVNNIWRWTAKDKNGKTVESSPGMPAFTSRGPESEAEMRKAAQQILNDRARMEWYAAGQPEGWDSPGYKVDAIQPMGHSDQGAIPIGVWQPPGKSDSITMPQPEVPAE